MRAIAFLIILAWPAHARAAAQVFPRSDEVFRKLLADPRQIQLWASYYRHEGRNTGDVGLGHSWGMRRWLWKEWTLQRDIEGLANSRFLLSGSVNEFQTVDFFANLPLEFRRREFSGIFMLFHESSHLGDDYIRRTNDKGFRYSVDGLRTVLSLEPPGPARIYIGGSHVLHSIPSPDRGAIQAGLELTGPSHKMLGRYPAQPYLAQDFHWKETVRWNGNSHTVLGVKLKIEGVIRSMRMQVGYFNGHSPYGQFYTRHEHYADIGMGFDL
ncbi:MAG: DUF1207 domain-containing protein [Elusimicrobia bacterium]|nr:DUF1207 domain-containing protein [Elusimicrobiota bacterium]